MDKAYSLKTPKGNTPLADLLSRLGPDIATPISMPNPDITVVSLEFYDAHETTNPIAGTLLIAPASTEVSTRHFSKLLKEASSLQYAAVCIKCNDEDVPTFKLLAEHYSICIIRVANHVSWRLFEAMNTQHFEERQLNMPYMANADVESLFSIADDLATQLGGSVTVEDLERSIIAYSSLPDQLIDMLRTEGILRRKVPDDPVNYEQYSMVMQSPTSVRFTAQDDEKARIAIAIRAGTMPLGTIWIVDTSPTNHLTAQQENQLQVTASIAAAYMLGNINSSRAVQLPKENLLRALLSGQSLTGNEFDELGLLKNSRVLLIAFTVTDDDDPSQLHRLRSVVERQISVYRPEVSVTTFSGKVYALISFSPSDRERDIVDPLLLVLEQIFNHTVRIALPGNAETPADIAVLRHIAERLLDPTPHRTDTPYPRVATLDEHRPSLIIDEIASLFRANSRLRNPQVTRMVEEAPLIAQTVLSWCRNFGNIARTSRELGLHENTVRYRIQQGEDQYHLKLADPQSALATWMQLQSERVTNKNS